MLQDVRDYQILFLGLFLILGISTRDWTFHPQFILVSLVTCLLTQWILSSIILPTTKINIRSPLITSLGISLLLRSDQWTTIVLAATTAIGSKFVFQVRDKHFFNPANFGIVTALSLTSDAWVSPGQWGEEWWYGLLFVGGGSMILNKVGRWDTTAAFLGVYSLLEALRNLWLGWTWDVYLHRLTSGSLLLFALFMVTDPRSIPDATAGRVLWSGLIALVTFILRNYFYLPTAVFWALFSLAPLTMVVDVIWFNPQFSWSGIGDKK
ncbi:RnfABCDGE type electron transport complex subunit D [Cylindrospermopsis raciborskii]|uniref:Na+-transporting NADH:ubiquinone oxidoreductase, subunit NqrB n=1 Tax=Cylindrospermopsis raciborskii CENA303 TaxID=1170769 RepID=A0A1X4G8Y4_9CYAN|nr:RnfABCDGE type electron transport complex subunit D [Cylindrospermopsis raciborskii]EFA73158.1 conserved hypothetical protein [Raphidiopsis brookii D9]MCZ2201212.1 RnfABCDGE type electron transport complex subunit D [Cylindrospermopsis raciborskii PAMP2012]MCZ2205911.1 RnfABCDGE type electron transport complex subunit D [Cylindrospermopsis raciborskii PAMP2011]OSO93314.1 Na+-transporting NADH:ubiquinone oxidoreductase, subunit NqrB [Cylindrospermopsis raciborskii CENA303]